MNKKLLVMRVLTAIGLGALVSLIVGIIILNPLENTLVPCAYYTRYGIKCMTCGGTRFVYCLFTFRWAEALYYHAYLMVLSPIIGYFILSFSLSVFLGRKVLPFPKRWYIYLTAFFVGLAVFGVVRNFVPQIY